MRFALDNDALRRAVAVAIRRDRRGYKKEQRSCEKMLGVTINCSPQWAANIYFFIYIFDNSS